MKIINNYIMYSQIADKRFYPPFDIFYTCPNCGENYKFNDYISYPDVNTPFNLNFYCNMCEYEWTEKIKIKIKGEVVK